MKAAGKRAGRRALVVLRTSVLHPFLGDNLSRILKYLSTVRSLNVGCINIPALFFIYSNPRSRRGNAA